MSVLFFCPRWGSENLDWDRFCEKVQLAGYQGIEYAIASDTSDQELELAWNSAEKYDLLIIPQHFDTVAADFSQHLESYHSWLERMKTYPAFKINSQTGKDFFSFEHNLLLIELGIVYGVVHETHRGKFSFAAHVTKTYLEKIPELRLTLDASHWVCVAESLLEDQHEAMELALERTEHIHARLGHAEGPQVSDPRLSEWQEVLERHLSWWDRVATRKRILQETLTVTAEFGPYPYMVQMPGTGKPIANQWEINRYMMDLLRKRYE